MTALEEAEAEAEAWLALEPLAPEAEEEDEPDEEFLVVELDRVEEDEELLDILMLE